MKKIGILILFAMIFVIASQASLGVILDGYSHTNDYYSVSYDGEGDAIVRAKIVISNDGESDISDLSLEFPGRSIVFYGVFQESSYPSRITSISEEVTSESTILKIELNDRIPKGSKGSVTILYKIPSSAEKSLGVYSFNFRTIIDPKAKLVENVRVAVNVDKNLYLKGTKADVDYRMDFFSASSAEKVMASSDVALQGSVSNVMYASGLVKTASNLDPWESFSVKGEYSKNYFLIHKGAVFGVIILAIALFATIFFGVRKLRLNVFPEFSRKKFGDTLPITLISAGQAFGIFLLWIAGWILLKNLQSLVGYRYDDLFALAIIMTLAVLLISVLLMPPWLVAKREGAFRGVLTFVLAIGWGFLIIIVMVIIFSMSSPQQVVY